LKQENKLTKAFGFCVEGLPQTTTTQQQQPANQPTTEQVIVTPPPVNNINVTLTV
jgi:hypothetical protein